MQRCLILLVGLSVVLMDCGDDDGGSDTFLEQQAQISECGGFPEQQPTFKQQLDYCDAEVLAWGTRILQQATPCDLLVVDELGPLKFERGEGWTPPGSGRPQGSTPPVLGWDCPGSFWLSPA